MSHEARTTRVNPTAAKFLPVLLALGAAAPACGAPTDSGTSRNQQGTGGLSALGSDGMGGTYVAGAMGGASSGGTDATPATGGATTGGETGVPTTGGQSSTVGTGGATQATGGQSTGGFGAFNTGGTSQATGGTSQATGGTSQATGGQSTGGFGAFNTGGQSTGGFGAFNTGGQGSGGTNTGGQGSGGTNTGGQGSGGTSTGGTATVDPDAATHVSECIDSLPWGQSNIADRDEMVGVIIRTCEEFAPPGNEWQTYCQMFLVAAINKESSFNASSVVEDSYGGSTDPTVGLTQIRFSSTVKDFASMGPVDALKRIGCDFPDSVTGDSAQPYLDMMKAPACNVGLGAWYYFVYGTGNGGSQVVYLAQYCQGQGVASTLTIGMLSHLRGPSGAVGGGSDSYVDQIREWFDNPACNGPSSGTHPFALTLQPEPSKYCR